jgi:O-antigen/teichoic acid export membrane protein
MSEAVPPATLASRLPRPLAMLEQRFRLVTFITTMVPTMGALALQFVTFAITARGLGVEQFGRYTALLAIVGVGVELVGLGGADVLVRAVARDKTRFPAYYGNMLILAGLSLPIVVALGTAVAVGAMQSTVELPLIVAALAAEIGVARISASLELVMVAQGNTARAGWLRMSTVLVRLALAAVYFLALGQSDLVDWIWLVLAQAALVCVVYVWLGASLYGRPVWQLFSSELHAGTLFCITQTARAAQSNLDRMVLSRYADDAALGLYGAASRFLQLGMFPVQVLTRILYPKYFVHGADGLAASRRYALRMSPALLGVGVFSGLLVAAAALLAPRVLGAQYDGSVAITVGLAFSLPLMALQYPAADALTGAGFQGLRATIYSVASIGFGFVLLGGVKLGGINGLVAAFLAGHLLLGVALWTATFVCKDKAA